MRILMASRQFWPFNGGIESASLLMAQSLVQMHHQVEVVTLDQRIRGGQKRLPRRDQIGRIQIHRVSSLSNKYCLPIWRPPQRGYDVIHLHGIDGFLELVHWFGMEWKIPVVLHSHGLIFHTPRLLPVKNWYWQHMFSRRVRGVTVIASSVNDARKLGEIGIDSTVVPNPVRLIGLPLEDDRPIDFIYLGRIAQHKGLMELLQVFKLVRQWCPKVNLVLVGEDWDGTLKSLMPLPRGVTWTGVVTEAEKWSLLQSSKIAVFPSHAEGFGVAVVEALSAGALVMANAIPAYGEIISSEENGFLCDYRDTGTTAQLLLRLLELDNGQRARVQANGIATASLYDPARIANLILDLYARAGRSDLRNGRRKYAGIR